MLQTNTVEKTTFELLKQLMQAESLKNFFLVGGTNVALRLGHRISIDLDLFTQNDINTEELNAELKSKYNFKKEYERKNTLKGSIQNVKLDFISYKYPFIKPLQAESNINLLSLEDICAMKLSAIENNGSRVKDFTDIAFLSELFSFNQMVSFYKTKFNTENTFMIAKALVYFDDIDFEDEPVQLTKGKFSWKKIATRLIDMTNNPDKVYQKQRAQLYDSVARNYENTYERSR